MLDRRIHTREEPFSCSDGGKNLVGAQVFLVMREPTQGRYPLVALTVEKVVGRAQILLHIRQFIYDRIPITAQIVGKGSI